MNLFTKQKHTLRHREQIHDDQIRERGKDNLGAWGENTDPSRYTIAKERGPIWYSRRLSAQYSVTMYINN